MPPDHHGPPQEAVNREVYSGVLDQVWVAAAVQVQLYTRDDQGTRRWYIAGQDQRRVSG